MGFVAERAKCIRNGIKGQEFLRFYTYTYMYRELSANFFEYHEREIHAKRHICKNKIK